MAEATQNTGDQRPAARPIVAWVFLAILIAAGLNVAAGILLGDEVATPEDYRNRGADYADMVDLVLILVLCVAASVAVWISFQTLLFRKRARLWKSVIGLVTIVLVATLAGVISRAATISHYIDQDREALREIRSNLNRRLSEMRDETERTGRALRADRGLPEFHNLLEITNALTGIRDQRQQIRDFEAAADAEIERAKQQMLALDVYEGERAYFIAQLDEILAPTSATHRLFDLENALLDKQEEAVMFLLEHRAAWSFYEGTLQFHDREALRRMNEIMREAYDIIPQIDMLEGAGGQGVPRAEPEAPL